MSNEDGQHTAAIFIEGVVVRGDGRGRLLGYPTANVALQCEDVLPDDGVYAGTLSRADGSKLVAAVSIGRRPTYYGDEGPRLLEVHILDFSEDLYDEHVAVHVGERVRGQLRFSSSEELVERIESDIEAVRRLNAPGRQARGH